MAEREKKLDRPRPLKSTGRKDERYAIRCYTLPEISRAWLLWSKRFGKRKRQEIIEAGGDSSRVEPGESMGIAHTTPRLVLWFLSLTDEDQQRIQEEGEALLMRLRMLPDRDDRLAIEPDQRKKESVFCDSELEPGVARKGSGMTGNRLPKRGGKPESPEHLARAGRPDHGPVGV